MKSISELYAYVSSLPNNPGTYRIAVGALIFTSDDKVLLMKRGVGARSEPGKLEGVGGGFDESDIDLHFALHREIKEELGNVDVSIEELLTVMVRPSQAYPGEWFVVPVYLCRLNSGEPTVQESLKCGGIYYFELSQIPEDSLTAYQKETMQAYKAKYRDVPFYK
jgi:ADP-ribose pyrophosphatase YjhB (NUDIX family)